MHILSLRYQLFARKLACRWPQILILLIVDNGDVLLDGLRLQLEQLIFLSCCRAGLASAFISLLLDRQVLILLRHLHCYLSFVSL